MNARLLAALGTGIVSQVLALRAYMLLSRLWPDNSSKYIGFIILAFGSVFAVQLLGRLKSKMALLGIALLAISAPLVSLFTLARAEEMAPDAAHALFFVSRGFALAFPCYAAAWLIFRALASKSLPAPPPTTDVARHVE